MAENITLPEGFQVVQDSGLPEGFFVVSENLSDLGKELNRGNNWAGGARNYAQGLSVGTADEIEAFVRSGGKTGGDKYDKYLQNARESIEGFARANPSRAIALQIAGGLTPSLLTFGAAAPASTAGLLTRGVISGLKGAGLGGIAGFASGKGGFEDRLNTAIGGGALGLAAGGLTPIATSALGKMYNTTKRIVKGVPESSLPAQQVEKFTLGSNVLSNTPEGNLNAEILRQGSAAGALDIYNPLYKMNATLEASKKLRNPGMLVDTLSETPSAQRIIDAAKTPQLKLAEKRYSDFLSKVEETPGQGLVAQNFLKRNPIAAKILSVEPSLKGLKLGSFNWFKKAESTLNNSLPKNLDTQRAVGRRASILNAIDDMSNIRETIHPGTTAANRDYAIGKAWQESGNNVAAQRLKFMRNLPVEEAPGLSSTDILRIGGKPFVRGRARELIQTGKLYERTPQTLEDAASAEVISILNALRNTGN